MGFYTITSGDVGKRHIKAFGRSWLVSSVMGAILPRDVGKRIYDRVEGVLQVENDDQFKLRLQRESSGE